MTFKPGPANPPPFSAGPHLLPQFDPLETLPSAAAERLRMLRQRAADAHALVPKFEEQRLASMEKTEAANALKRLTDHQQNGGFNLPPGDNRVVSAERHLAKITDHFERIKQRSETRAAAWQAASAALANVETWLKSGRPGNTTLEAVEVELPKLNRGETVLDGIERLRRRGRELRADLHRIASAPYPSSYAKQRMRAQIEALAMQGAPSASALIEFDGKIEFQTQRLTSEVHAERRALAFTEVPDAVALMCWLHKDALIAALDREIASEADDKAALSHEARQRREAEVQGDLLAVERDESWFVWSAQAAGLPVEHRADISPLALLGLRLVTAPYANETPGTTPGYSWPMQR